MNYTYGSTSGGIRTLRRWKAADMFDCYQAFACRHPLRPRVAGFACAGLHALCNLKSVPYVANMGGISAESLSPKVQEVYSVCGMHNGATGDYGTSSLDIQDLASTLIDRGEISEAQLENEIASLMSTVYSDPGYINSMTPFF